MKKLFFALTILLLLVSTPFLAKASPAPGSPDEIRSAYAVTGKGRDAATAASNARVAALRSALKTLVSSDFVQKNAEAVRKGIILKFSEFTSEATVEGSSQKENLTAITASVTVDMPKLAEALKALGAPVDPAAIAAKLSSGGAGSDQPSKPGASEAGGTTETPVSGQNSQASSQTVPAADSQNAESAPPPASAQTPLQSAQAAPAADSQNAESAPPPASAQTPLQSAQTAPAADSQNAEPAPAPAATASGASAQAATGRSITDVLTALGARAGDVSHDPGTKTLTITDFVLPMRDENAKSKDSVELRVNKIIWSGFSPDALRNESIPVDSLSLSGVQMHEVTDSDEMTVDIAGIDLVNWKLTFPASGSGAMAWKKFAAAPAPHDGLPANLNAHEGNLFLKDNKSGVFEGTLREFRSTSESTTLDGQLTGLRLTFDGKNSFQAKVISFNSIQMPPISSAFQSFDKTGKLSAESMAVFNGGGKVSIQDSELRFTTGGQESAPPVQHLVRLAELSQVLSPAEKDTSHQYTVWMKGLDLPPSVLSDNVLGCPPNTLKAFLANGEQINLLMTTNLVPGKPDGKKSQMDVLLNTKHLGDIKLSCAFTVATDNLFEFATAGSPQDTSADAALRSLQNSGLQAFMSTLLNGAEVSFTDRGALAFLVSLASELSKDTPSNILAMTRKELGTLTADQPASGLEKVTSAFAKAALLMLEKPGILNGSISFSSPIPIPGLLEIPKDVTVNTQVVPGEKPLLEMLPAPLQ